jgi:hypothetical protein
MLKNNRPHNKKTFADRKSINKTARKRRAIVILFPAQDHKKNPS